jgi:hypothetical protein
MRYGATVRLSPERALEKAKDYFGRLGLAMEEESSEHLLFRNDAGYVQLRVLMEHGTELEMETRGFDQQVKQFLQRIG